jgi:hypothetical protein
LPTDPSPGSYRYFVLLYTPAARRRELATLLALGDEIGADPLPDADHGIAHARLAWWRREAERLRQGAPEHPWLRSLLQDMPAPTRFDLAALVDAAEVDLAARTLRNQASTDLFRALFVTAGCLLLDEDPQPAVRAAIAALGATVARLERDPGDKAALGDVGALLLAIGAQRQQRLLPLLVWLALAASGPRTGNRLRNTLSTNFAAWSAARQAARGRFKPS